ncbi:MAG: glycosyltransferase family 61 protein [Selenomonadaceae bacterium]|nr:glycosyltransferase family 61 protein [Selenomonadaceae bacterium]
MFESVWGHVITDNIRRLWFLKSNAFKQEFKNCPLVYVPLGNVYSDNKSFKRLPEILEIDLDTLQPIKQPIQFKQIILPNESYRISGKSMFTKEYRETIQQIKDFALKNRTPTSCDKIYFYHGLRQIGEERLAEYFKSKGYEIIPHERRVDFDEELNLLINAKSCASTLGSCAHNSLFLREGTEAIFIPRIYNLGSTQLILNQVSHLHANYVDSSLSIFGSDNVRWFCYIISEQLKRFFGDKWNGYEEEDFKTFLQYVKDSMSKGLAINPKAEELYGEVFSDFMAQLKRQKNLITTYNMPPRWETFPPQLTYLTHVHIKGSWTDGLKLENQISNPLDQKFDVLAIRINYPRHKVYYSVYYDEKEGWTEEVSDNKWAGVTNRQKPIYGMRIRLDEAGTREFNILYRMHKFDDTWTKWAKNGEALYSYGQKLNAIQIKLEPVKAEPDKVDVTESEYAQKFLAGRDETIYLQVQIQDLNQIKWETKVDTQADKKL